MKREIDLCVISDICLGTLSCPALELLKYLKSIKPVFLIFNGNFIDPAQFKKKYFSKKHLLVIHQIMNMALHGTKVVIITGEKNHPFRNFAGVNLGNIHLRKEMILKLRGKEYLIDQGSFPEKKSMVSDGLSNLSFQLNSTLRQLGFSHKNSPQTSGKKSLPFSLKRRNTITQSQIEKRNKAIAENAFKRGIDAVISNSIPQPEITTLTPSGKTIELMSSGDWTAHLSTLEFANDRWEIYQYSDLDYGFINPKLSVDNQPEYSEDGVFIVRKSLNQD